MHMYLFIEINAIFIIHNINSDISFLVVAHTLFRIKFAVKIELDIVCDPVWIYFVLIEVFTLKQRKIAMLYIQRIFLRAFSNMQ